MTVLVLRCLLVLLLTTSVAWGQAQLINGSRVIVGWINAGVTSGSATAYTLTLSPPMPGYVTHQCYLLSPHVANTGAATLNVNGLGSKPFKKWSAGVLVDLVANDFVIGRLVQICYDGTNMQVLLGTAATGTGVTDGDKGDITVSGSGATWTIDAAAVTYAKMQTVSTTSVLLGRGSASTGAPQEITLGTNLSMTGTTLNATGGGAGVTDGDKGDITVSSTGTVWTIDTSAVTYAKLQNTTAPSVLLGRGSASAGVPQEITLGSGLSMAGTTLSVSAGGGNVSNSGTPVDNQVAVWTTASQIEGTSALTYNAGVLSLGTSGTLGGLNLAGNTSGIISVRPQAAAGTFNWNLPTSAGSSSQVLTSGGGGTTPMTWTTLAPSATTDTTNASNLTSGTLALARIADDSIPYTKLPNAPASVLLGRGAGAGTGDLQEITLGTNLSMAGATLNATGGSGGHTIQDEGTSRPARTNLNFTGQGVSCVDNAGSNSTECSISGTGGAVGIFGTPVAGQLAVWHDAGSIEGASALSINYLATHVATAGTPTTTIQYVTTGPSDLTSPLPPAASGTNTREFVYIKEDSGAGAMVIAPNGGNTINGIAGPISTLTQWGGFVIKEVSATGWVATPFAPTLPTGGGGSGTVDTGVNGRAAYYTGATTVDDSAGLTLDATDVLTYSPKVTAISANTTLGIHNVVACTSGTGTVIATLPATATAASKHYTLVKVDTGSGVCRIAPAAGEQLNWVVNGTQDLAARGDSVTVTAVAAGVWLAESGLTQSSLAALPLVRTVGIDVGALQLRGSCTESAAAALVTNGPIVSAIACTDSDTDGFDVRIPMPDAWNGSTITVQVQGFYTGTTHTSPNNIVDFNFSGQCVRSGDVPAAWAITSGATAESATNVEAQLTTNATANREIFATTTALTLAGTCAGGATVYLHALVDAASTTFTPMSDFKLLGLKLEYTRIGND